MGIELNPNCNNNEHQIIDSTQNSAPIVLGLQPAAMVDHVAKVDWSLLAQISGERGGSFPVAVEELNHIVCELNKHILASPDDSLPSKTIAGGSIANTIRGLAAGFGITTGMIGACGNDEQGSLFMSNMTSNKVNLSRLRLKNGSTAQCVCMVDESGNRTMRPCLSSAVKVQAEDLTRGDFKGSKWLMLRYAILNVEVINEAVRIAKEEGLLVSLDLASFEMVRKFRLPLLQLLESGNIDLCFANEDEAQELLRGEQDANPEAALDFLAKHCQWAVVTLGANGCIAKHGKKVVRVPAIGKTMAVDATGAGDLFACGFLYGLIKGLPLDECCKVGSCSGGSVIRSLGGEVTPANWQWMYKQMQSEGLLVPDLGKCHLL
ncbi:carbohydrate kinase [Lithospermum erythrorhizon]|uniref:Carbohydrate kinase n=1 Tax=Lithospermum erythrorhizon TaxID=34254 RepID=A0AAV3NP12_LITER